MFLYITTDLFGKVCELTESLGSTVDLLVCSFDPLKDYLLGHSSFLYIFKNC